MAGCVWLWFLCLSQVSWHERGSETPRFVTNKMDIIGLHTAECLCNLYQQNVIRSENNTQSSQTLRMTSPVLLSTSRYSQTPLEVSKVLSDSTRVFSGAPASTWSNGGAFRMLWDLTYRIVKFWNYWDHCADRWETSREPEAAAQLCGILRGQLKLLRSSAGYFESSRDLCAALQETWCRILTAVVFT